MKSSAIVRAPIIIGKYQQAAVGSLHRVNRLLIRMVRAWRREGNHYDVVFAEADMESTDCSLHKGKSFSGCGVNPRAGFEGVT